MRKSAFRFTLVSSILCFLPISVPAQERQPGEATEQQQQDQATPQQNQATRRPGRVLQREQQLQRGEILQRGQQQRRQAQAQTLRLESFLVNKLILANRAEVELSQMAGEMVQNEELKEFAKNVIEDHRKLNQELMQLSSEDADVRRLGQTRRGEAAENGADQTRPDQAARPQRRADSPDRNRSARLPMRGQGALPQQLMRMAEKASEFKLLMISELLAAVEEGKELDKAYLGIQIIEHTGMLAELEAMKGTGSEEFQQLVIKSYESTREHLEEAKELAKKLK